MAAPDAAAKRTESHHVNGPRGATGMDDDQAKEPFLRDLLDRVLRARELLR